MEVFILKYAEAFIALLILIVGFIIRKWINDDKEYKMQTNSKLNLILQDVGSLKMDYQLLKSSHNELGVRMSAESIRVSTVEAKIEVTNEKIVKVEKDINLLTSHHHRNHPEDKI